MALAAEDFGLRVPPVPSKLGRGRTKTKKMILTPELPAKGICGAQEPAQEKEAASRCSPDDERERLHGQRCQYAN